MAQAAKGETLSLNSVKKCDVDHKKIITGKIADLL